MTQIARNMKGAYSDIKTRTITAIVETNVGGDGWADMDAPIIIEIEQEEFTSEVAHETQDFC